MADHFGDRMKMYEKREGERFMPLLPIYVRLDGKGFSKFTKGMTRPYDERMQRCMIETTKKLVKATNARIGYTQSDEISLVLYSDSVDSQVWFDGKKQKIVSVLASMATAWFNAFLKVEFKGTPWADNMAFFDCRAFNLPNKIEATNAVLWREQDATKNAVSMAARSFFSHKELDGQGQADMQEMLFRTHGINFNDFPAAFKRGTFVRRETFEKEIHIPATLAGYSVDTKTVMRSEVVEMNMPKFGSVVNRVDVIFEGKDPETESNWKPTNDRTHEECADCALEKVEPIRCFGHEHGPVACTKFTPL